jgi:hypothetical protein
MDTLTDIQELERFLQEDADFERLEGIASQFNPFEAMSWTRQELRHSAFIRWMFDPSETHGLGTYPLRTFLKYIVGRGLTGPEAPTLLDLIFEHRPDRQQYLSHVVEEAVKELGGTLDQCSKGNVRWVTPGIGRLPAIGEGWTRTGRMLLFEMDSYGKKMVLKLILGPGPEEFRKRIHAAVQGQSIFNKHSSKLYPKWWTFHSLSFLSKKQSESMELEEAEDYVRERLAKFFADEVPAIEEALLSVIMELEAEHEAPAP